MKTEEMIYNFLSPIMDFKGKEPSVINENFNSVFSDFITLCDYYHDYSPSEMIGIIKLLEAFFVFDDNMNIADEKHKPSIIIKLRQQREKLQVIKESRDMDTRNSIIGDFKRKQK